MTEIPEHLRKRAENARAKGAGQPVPHPELDPMAGLFDSDTITPRTLRETLDQPPPRQPRRLSAEEIAAAYGITVEELRAESNQRAATRLVAEAQTQAIADGIDRLAESFAKASVMLLRSRGAHQRAAALGYESTLDYLEALERACRAAGLVPTMADDVPPFRQAVTDEAMRLHPSSRPSAVAPAGYPEGTEVVAVADLDAFRQAAEVGPNGEVAPTGIDGRIDPSHGTFKPYSTRSDRR